MIFNTSFIVGLTLSSLSFKSPLLTNSPNLISTSIFFQNLHLKKITFYAFYLDSSLSNFSIHRSHFEQFLKTPISIQQITCSPYSGSYQNHYNVPCAIATYCTFRYIKEGAFNISCDSETTSIFDHCSFIRCSSSINGGAISFNVFDNSNMVGILNVTSSTFEYCSVNTSNNQEARGGAIFFCGRSLNVVNSTFRYINIFSKSGKCCGGAIYASMADDAQSFFYDTFEDCNIPDCTDSCGGAIYISKDGSYPPNVQLFSCTFLRCFANNGSAFYSDKVINLVINATRFSKMKANTIVHLAGIGGSNKLFIKSLGIILVEYNYFIFTDKCEFLNKKDDSGIIYFDEPINYTTFTNQNIGFTFLNVRPINEMPQYTYVDPPTIEPTTEIIQTQTQNQEQTQSQTEEHVTSSVITNSIDEPSSIQQVPEPTSATNNSDAIIAPASTKKGLSTVAIIFIVLACVILLAGLIIIIFLLLRSKDGCYRNQCTGSSSYLEKRTTYF